MDLQRKAQENMMDQERKAMEFEERLDLDKMKLRICRRSSRRKN